MKQFVMAALLMTGVATFAQTEAQPVAVSARPLKEKLTPELRAKQLTDELGLDAKQQGQVQELFINQDKARAEFKEQRKAATDEKTKADLLAKVKTDRIDFNTKMKAILTEEQFKKWEASSQKKSRGTLSPPKALPKS